MTFSINIKGKLITYKGPIVMGIVNSTPDSFFDGEKERAMGSLKNRIDKMVQEGVDVIDFGGESSRPGAKLISINEEIDRVGAIIEWTKQKYSKTPISIDTVKQEVALSAFNSGADIVNDISAGEFDKKMIPWVGKNKIPYIAMHKQGSPETMQDGPMYEDVVADVASYFVKKVDECKSAGVHDLIIDLGFGFGKTVEHNYILLNHINYFNELFNLPILVGLSRKSMINKVLNIEPKDALNGTTVLHTIAIQGGASILRVHDVKEANQTIKLVKKHKEILDGEKEEI